MGYCFQIEGMTQDKPESNEMKKVMTATERDNRIGPDVVDGICNGVVFSVLHYDGYSLVWPTRTKYSAKQAESLLPTLAYTLKGELLGSVVKLTH